MDLSKLSIQYIDGYETVVKTDGMTQKDKILPYMTIVYPYQGHYEICLGDDPLTTLHHGEGCYMTAPGARHTIVHRLDPGEDKMMPRWLRFSVMYDQVLDVTSWFELPFLVTGEQAKPFIDAIDQLILLRQAETHAKNFGKLRLAATLLENLLQLCPFHPATLELERVYPAVLMVKDCYGDTITVEKLAAACAMSPATFYRLFRQTIHKTPMQYLDEYRLKQAAQRLLFEKQTLAQIAEDCGYYDEFHLSRNFKKYYGVSPKTYKRQTIL